MIKSNPSNSSQRETDQSKGLFSHVPGAIGKIASKTYFERGSLPVIEMNNWRMISFILSGLCVLLTICLASLMPLKSLQIISVTKDQNGRLNAETASMQKFEIDDQIKMSWVNDWVANLVEINPSTWERDVAKSLGKSVNTASDQARDYLRKEENQPAHLLVKFPNYIREMQRQSINMLQSDMVLIRYTLTSRESSGIKKIQSYTMTVNLKTIAPNSTNDAINNPSGLVVSNFSLSDENLK